MLFCCCFSFLFFFLRRGHFKKRSFLLSYNWNKIKPSPIYGGWLLIKLNPFHFLSTFLIFPGTDTREAESEQIIIIFCFNLLFKTIRKKANQTHCNYSAGALFLHSLPMAAPVRWWDFSAAGLVQLCCSPSPVLRCSAFAGVHQDAPARCWCSTSGKETSCIPLLPTPLRSVTPSAGGCAAGSGGGGGETGARRILRL